MEKKKYITAILTLSDKGSVGEREDKSGEVIKEILLSDGKYDIVSYSVISDDYEGIKEKLIELSDKENVELILTTGGTGFSKRDNTPEATMAIATRNAPGISEYMRMKSMEITPKAMLSRGVSVIRNNTLIINLPGSPKAVRENLEQILGALDHGLDILLGRDSECARK